MLALTLPTSFVTYIDLVSICSRRELSVYRTSNGERILLGAERRLFEQSLAMMVDHLSIDDCDFGVPVFGELQRGQKLFALYRAGRGLLRPDEAPPELTAFLEAAVAAVYRHALDKVIMENGEARAEPA